jgi:cyclopropane fatty-acyl-phospholipid synthase-like methyltransferase
MNLQVSRNADYFRRLYEADPDPWDFRSSDYETTKYRKTLEALGTRHFHSVLEVGCSIGVLTGLLASRSEHVLGVDLVEAPLVTARATCAGLPGVQFRRMRVPEEWPAGSFDLIVLSEILYYLNPADSAALCRRIEHSLVPRGLVVLVNWLGATDEPCSGEQAAEAFIAATRRWLALSSVNRNEGYRMDVLTRSELVSWAA